jgi:Calcineurin-like phosphoesterase
VIVIEGIIGVGWFPDGMLVEAPAGFAIGRLTPSWKDLAVVTAVVSDLHLGTRSQADLLRRPEVRERLIEAVEKVDHVVLLGDSIELRDGPPAEALEIATPFFEQLGEVMAGRRVTVVAGNHDYQLASPWLARRRQRSTGPLRLEELSAPATEEPLGRLARRMGRAEVVLAYPGAWLRPDVYATHGHYLDCHNDVLTFECVARRVSEILTREPRDGYQAPDDYEAVLGPVYRAIYRVAQSQRARSAARGAKALVRRWETVAGYRGPRRRPGLGAMAKVVDGLGIRASYVIFGHLHRAGPTDADGTNWTTPRGVRLVNSGSWVYEPAYLGQAGAQSEHWPGTCVVLGREGRPEVKRLLGDDAVRIHSA